MAYIHRLIFLMLALFSTLAQASFPSSPQWKSSRYAGVLPWVSSPNAACTADMQKYVSGLTGWSLVSVSVSGTNSTNCTGTIQTPTGTGTTMSGLLYQGSGFCPENSTLSGGVCTCTAPAVQNAENNGCSAPVVDDLGICKGLVDVLNYSATPLVHFGSVGLTACYMGYVLEGSGGAGSGVAGGQSELYGPFKCSLGTDGKPKGCTPVPKPPEITGECAMGTFPGTVNGVEVCVPPDKSVTGPTTTTASPPTPGASAPPIPGAPPGTTTTTEETTCSGGSCTTTTDYKDDAGESLGKTETTVTKTQYCQDNPDAPGCDDGESSFSGSCGGGFECEGDALLCAIAQEQYKINCKLYENDDDSNSEYNKAVSGNDESNIEKLKDQAETIDIPDFDKSGFGWSTSCPADPVIPLNFGRSSSFAIPFSRICDPLGVMSAAGVGITLLGAMLWVLGSKKS
jgi:hypothetical protein